MAAACRIREVEVRTEERDQRRPAPRTMSSPPPRAPRLRVVWIRLDRALSRSVVIVTSNECFRCHARIRRGSIIRRAALGCTDRSHSRRTRPAARRCRRTRTPSCGCPSRPGALRRPSRPTGGKGTRRVRAGGCASRSYPRTGTRCARHPRRSRRTRRGRCTSQRLVATFDRFIATADLGAVGRRRRRYLRATLMFVCRGRRRLIAPSSRSLDSQAGHVDFTQP